MCYRWCDIDLAAFFGPGGADRVRDGWYSLLDPSNSAKEVSTKQLHVRPRRQLFVMTQQLHAMTHSAAEGNE